MRRGIGAAVLIAAVAACKQQEQAPAAAAGPAPGSREWKIQDAMKAAPAEIAGAAAIMDWPDSAGHMAQLRAGTNGWTCMPDVPGTPANDPMCLDQQFMVWAGAWMGHKTPNVTGTGVGYMLMGADDASNTDPFASKPDSGKSWVHTGPHVMIIVPGARYPGVATVPKVGTPYVMFPGTPYAHIMAPTQAAAN